MRLHPANKPKMDYASPVHPRFFPQKAIKGTSNPSIDKCRNPWVGCAYEPFRGDKGNGMDD